MRLAGDDPLNLRPRGVFVNGAIAELREALAEAEACIDTLDTPARQFVRSVRAALDRYDEPADPRDADEFGHGLGEIDGGGE